MLTVVFNIAVIVVGVSARDPARAHPRVKRHNATAEAAARPGGSMHGRDGSMGLQATP